MTQFLSSQIIPSHFFRKETNFSWFPCDSSLNIRCSCGRRPSRSLRAAILTEQTRALSQDRLNWRTVPTTRADRVNGSIAIQWLEWLRVAPAKFCHSIICRFWLSDWLAPLLPSADGKFLAESHTDRAQIQQNSCANQTTLGNSLATIATSSTCKLSRAIPGAVDRCESGKYY